MLGLGCRPDASSRPPVAATVDPFTRAMQHYTAAVSDGRLQQECSAIAAAFEHAAAPGHPNQAVALLDAGALHAQCGRTHQAREVFARVAQGWPGRARAQALNATAALDAARDDLEAAWAGLEQAAVAQPQWPLVQANRERVVLAMLSRGPPDTPLWQRRGEGLAVALERTGQPTHAAVLRIQIQHASRRRAPDPAEQRGLNRAVAKALARADITDAQAARLMVLQAESAMEQGSFGTAAALLDRAAARDPSSGAPHARFALVAARARDYGSAQWFAERALADPSLAGRVHLHVIQAVALTHDGRVERAGVALERAATLLGQDPGARLLFEHATAWWLGARANEAGPNGAELSHQRLRNGDRQLQLVDATAGRADVAELRARVAESLPQLGYSCDDATGYEVCKRHGSAAIEITELIREMERREATQRLQQRARLLELERKARKAHQQQLDAPSP